MSRSEIGVLRSGRTRDRTLDRDRVGRDWNLEAKTDAEDHEHDYDHEHEAAGGEVWVVLVLFIVLVLSFGKSEIENEKENEGRERGGGCYSALKAIMGSTFVARRAGTNVATSETSVRSAATAT